MSTAAPAAGERHGLTGDRSGRLDSAAAALLLEQWLRDGPSLNRSIRRPLARAWSSIMVILKRLRICPMRDSGPSGSGDVPTVLVRDAEGRDLLCFLEQPIPSMAVITRC